MLEHALELRLLVLEQLPKLASLMPLGTLELRLLLIGHRNDVPNVFPNRRDIEREV
jgi:hypothetical protein